jgi:hypothetical protein
MQTYDAARCAMIALGTLTDGVNTSFPPLTVCQQRPLGRLNSE